MGYSSFTCLSNKHTCIMSPLLSLKILILFCCCVYCLLLFSEAHDQQQEEEEQEHSQMMNHKLLHKEGLNETAVTAVFVFGDSTVDPGNNNFFKTFANSKFPPYGRDLVPNHMPTGRFSNGKLSTDFVASYLGTKELVPPYLDPTLSFEDLLTGVSFASAGSGYDPLLPKILVTLTMRKQLELFMEYKGKLRAVIGKQRTEDHIKKAVFIISEGTNDFMITYYILTLPRLSFSIEEYEKLTLKRSREFLQGLTDLGAQRIAVVGVPPIGCVPYFMTLKSRGNNIVDRDCIDSYSAVARDYNKMLKDALVPMKESLANFKGLIVYVDIYTTIQDIIDNYKKYGYEEWSKSCCGTGLIELAVLCNPKSLTCSDASKYVFWDSAHPTEKTNYLLFDKAFRKILDQLVAH